MKRHESEIFFDAVTGVREDLIEEAQQYTFRRRRMWRRYVGAAACILLVAALGWSGLIMLGGGTGGNSAGTAPSDAAPPPLGEIDSGCGQIGDAPPVSGDTPEASEGYGGTLPSFQATVQAVGETWLEAAPLPDENCFDQETVWVVVEDAAILQGLAEGDVVRIFYTDLQQTESISRLTGRQIERIEVP